MKADIKLIALDLDGTLLSSQKELSARNRRALERAAAKGIHIVPSTGRLARAVPEFIAKLPFVRYMICVNGSHVYDKADDTLIYRAELPYQTAEKLMVRFDELPCIYDCYMGGRGWMQADMYERAEDFAENDYILELIRNTRTPVPNLKAFVMEQKLDAQKVQMFFHTIAERDHYKKMLQAELPELVVTSSYGANIEINCADATKGAALAALCRHIGIDISQTVAFGDGDNDTAMLRAAGIGVAMGNAAEDVQKAADAVTGTCDEDGVAQFIEQYIL